MKGSEQVKWPPKSPTSRNSPWQKPLQSLLPKTFPKQGQMGAGAGGSAPRCRTTVEHGAAAAQDSPVPKPVPVPLRWGPYALLLRKGSTISHLLVCILSGNHMNVIFFDETEKTLFPGRCLLSFPRLVTHAHSCFFLRRGICARKRIM